MAESTGGELTYVLKVERVRECIEELLGRNIHPHFPAYLYLRLLAGREGSSSSLDPDWAELGAFLEVDGAPAGKPYLRPFWHQKRTARQEWLNANLAGSYAPSSLRQTSSSVFEADAEGHFSLKPRHWEAARRVYLFDKRVPIAAVAGFFLRDYGFLASSEPTSADLVDVFRERWGYGDGDDAEVEYLYDTVWDGRGGSWFVPWTSDGENE